MKIPEKAPLEEEVASFWVMCPQELADTRCHGPRPHQMSERCGNSPVLSPTRSTGTSSLFSKVRYRFVNGVSSGYRMWRFPLSRPAPAPAKEERQLLDIVEVAVTHAAPVKDHHLI